MRILISAIACNPERGSEAHFGWAVVSALSRRHEIHVIGHGNDRPALEKAQAEGRIPGRVTFHYLGGWTRRHPNRILARLQNWQDYRWWSRAVLPLARELHARHPFSLVHHVTLSTWRVATPLWQLGIPLVWGPLGGAEHFPLRLFPILSPASMAYEAFRSLQGMLSLASPSVRQCARNSAGLIASNPETAKVLARLSGHPGKIQMRSAVFFNDATTGGGEVRAAGPFPGKSCPTVLRLFAGGDIEGRKGLALALRALVALKRRGIPFHYHVGGSGPETGHLQKLADRLGISDSVTLGVTLRGQAYQQALRDSHIYLLPSLRDNAPVTLMEAMLAGCVPVVADCGGPRGIVAPGCGIRIPVSRADKMVAGLSSALLGLCDDPVLMDRISAAAARHIIENYSESAYVGKIQAIYDEVLRNGERMD